MTRLTSLFLFVHAAVYWTWLAWGDSPWQVKFVVGVALYSETLMILLLHREARSPHVLPASSQKVLGPPTIGRDPAADFPTPVR
jgi:hypothetical protein